MQSKTSYFNKAIFLKNITRFWPVWGGYVFIWMIALPFFMLSRSTAVTSQPIGYWSGEYVLGLTGIFSVLMAMSFGIIAAMAVFSYLFGSKSAGMFHALPVRREGLFLSNYLAGLCFLLAPNAFIFLTTLGAEAIIGSVNGSALAAWFLVTCGLCIFFYSFAVLCAMFTGNLIFHPILYIILNFLVVGMEMLINGVLSVLLFGFSFSGTPQTGMFSPPVELIMHLKVQKVLDDTTGEVRRLILAGGGTVAIYAIVGILFAVIALLIYRKRHTESAGDVVSVPVLRPVFKYGVAFASALTIGELLFAIFFESYAKQAAVLVLPIYLLIGGYIGYTVAEMLLKKSFRVFRKGFRGYVAFAVVIILLTAAVELDILGFEKQIPEAGSVVSAEINGTKTRDAVKIAEALALQKSIVSNKNQIENTLSDDQGSGNVYKELPVRNGETVQLQRQSRSFLQIRYTMKNGALMTRAYTIPITRELLSDTSSPATRYDKWINSPELFFAGSIPSALNTDNIMGGSIHFYKETEKSITLTQQQARTLYTAVAADIRAGTIHHEWLLADETYYASVYALNIELEYSGHFREGNGNNDLKTDSFTISPEVASRNTVAALKSLGLVNETNPLITQLESIQKNQS